MGISGDKGVLSGGVRVSEESKVSTGGNVISATESKSIESGSLGSSERDDVSQNRRGGMVSRKDRWESWGVMNMVGKVLGGKLYVDDEVEDVNDSGNWGRVNVVGGVKPLQDVIGGNRGEVNLAADTNLDADTSAKFVSTGCWGVKPLQDVGENQGEVNSAADTSAHEDVMGELASANGVDIKRNAIDSDFVKLDMDCAVEGNIKNGNLDMGTRGTVPGGNLETEEGNDVKDDVLRSEGFGRTLEVNDVKSDVLLPKGDGELDLHINEMVPKLSLELGEEVNDDVKAESEEEVNDDVNAESEEVDDVKADMLLAEECGGETEKEEEYHASDLVWGKVRSHPWWPGQIFSPSAASNYARKYFKKDRYLVAYFGDQSFAWNNRSKLMPFRKYFYEMVKQTNTDGFSRALSCALDEAARRIESGLSCPCWPQEVRDEKRFQVVENAGIREDSSIIAGEDNVSTFSPGDVLQFIESLAKHPRSKQQDMLQFTIAKAGLQAYTRWKGYHELPVFEECIGLSVDDTQSNAAGKRDDSIKVPVSDSASKKRKSTSQSGSSGDEERPKRKEKFMSVLLSSGSSCPQKNDKVYVRKKTSKRAISSSKSHETVGSTCSDSRGKKPKTLLSSGAATSGIDEKLAKVGGGQSQTVEIILAGIPTPDMVLSDLISAAKRPLQRKDAMIPLVDWFREFRNSICLEKCSLADQEAGLGKQKEEQSS